MDHQLLVWAIT